MSLLNAWVSPDRALVAVDTDGITPAGEHFEISKMLPLVHARTLFAGRGDRKFLHDLVKCYFLAATAVTYDDIVDHLPVAIAHTLAAFKQEGAAPFEYQFAVVGWSPAQQRVCGQWITGSSSDDGYDCEELGQRVAPWNPPEMGVPVMPSSVDAMTQIAKVQAEWLRSQPNSAGGGRLIVAEVTKDRMTIESVAEVR